MEFTDLDITKIIGICIIFAETLLGVLIPAFLRKASFFDIFLSLGFAFSGGIFLSTGFIHMLPQGKELLVEGNMFSPDTLYYWIALGFFLIFMLEQIVFADVTAEIEGHGSHDHHDEAHERDGPHRWSEKSGSSSNRMMSSGDGTEAGFLVSKSSKTITKKSRAKKEKNSFTPEPSFLSELPGEEPDCQEQPTKKTVEMEIPDNENDITASSSSHSQQKRSTGLAQMSQDSSSQDEDSSSAELEAEMEKLSRTPPFPLRSLLLLLLALLLHSLIEGMSIGLLDDEDSVNNLLVAMYCHKIFEGIATGVGVQRVIGERGKVFQLIQKKGKVKKDAYGGMVGVWGCSPNALHPDAACKKCCRTKGVTALATEEDGEPFAKSKCCFGSCQGKCCGPAGISLLLSIGLTLSIATPLGVTLGMVIADMSDSSDELWSTVEGCVLGFAIGTFLYVGIVEVAYEEFIGKQKEDEWWWNMTPKCTAVGGRHCAEKSIKLFAMTIGLAIMAGVAAME